MIELINWDGFPNSYRLCFRVGEVEEIYEAWAKGLVDEIVSKADYDPDKALETARRFCAPVK